MVNENRTAKRLTLKLNKGTDPETGKVTWGSPERREKDEAGIEFRRVGERGGAGHPVEGSGPF